MTTTTTPITPAGQRPDDADCKAERDRQLALAILRGRRQIVLLWGVEDVIAVRPDLSEDQAWELLQEVEQNLDQDVGITPRALMEAAEVLFGPATDRAEGA